MRLNIGTARDTKIIWNFHPQTQNPVLKRPEWITNRYQKLHMLVLAFLSFALPDLLCLTEYRHSLRRFLGL
jgi:hypothetical protein